jgi:hypothetical protein
MKDQQIRSTTWRHSADQAPRETRRTERRKILARSFLEFWPNR